MAKSEAEKKAAAHEYYIKYRKKGIKKGRKKGSKKGSSTGLLGVSASGLNSDGAIEAAVIKDKMKKEMNEALKKAKTDEEKIAIRKEYAKKANAEIAKLKSDPKYAKQKATKSSSSKSGSSKGSSSKGSSSSGGSSKSSSQSSGSSSVSAQAVKQIQDSVAKLEKKLNSLTPEQKAQAKETIQKQIDAIKERLKKKTKGITLK